MEGERNVQSVSGVSRRAVGAGRHAAAAITRAQQLCCSTLAYVGTALQQQCRGAGRRTRPVQASAFMFILLRARIRGWIACSTRNLVLLLGVRSSRSGIALRRSPVSTLRLLMATVSSRPPSETQFCWRTPLSELSPCLRRTTPQFMVPGPSVQK